MSCTQLSILLLESNNLPLWLYCFLNFLKLRYNPKLIVVSS